MKHMFCSEQSRREKCLYLCELCNNPPTYSFTTEISKTRPKNNQTSTRRRCKKGGKPNKIILIPKQNKKNGGVIPLEKDMLIEIEKEKQGLQIEHMQPITSCILTS